jgi:diguanylate cyclase (GGDEF)-like protein
MNVFHELIAGSLSRVFASSLAIVILLLMFIISLRLYISRRNRGYFSLTLSILVVVAEHVLLIGLDLKHQTGAGGATDYMAQVLRVISFIFINMGVYQLYNRSRTKDYILFYLFTAITAAIAGYHFYFLARNPFPLPEEILLHTIWIDLYLFLLIFLCFYLIAPFVGQTAKYQAGLTVYFLIHCIRVVNVYLFGSGHLLLTVMENFLPLLFYVILFLIIFDRVVELMQAIYYSSITDGLTGLYNRRYFFNKTVQAVKRNMDCGVIFCDIDNFKKLNDTEGHQKGDDILKQVARIVREEVENIGIAGRYGGEEIVALLWEPKNIGSVAEKIRERVAGETSVTVSVGYSVRKKGATAEELVKQADEAMFISKTTGKNKVTKYKGKK